MATLSEYLQNTGISQKDFAETIGVDKGTVSRLVARILTPRLPLAVKIEAATGGEVKAVDLLATPAGQEGAA